MLVCAACVSQQRSWKGSTLSAVCVCGALLLVSWHICQPAGGRPTIRELVARALSRGLRLPRLKAQRRRPRRRPHRRGCQARQARDQAHPGGEHGEGDAARGPLGGALLGHVTASRRRRERATPRRTALHAWQQSVVWRTPRRHPSMMTVQQVKGDFGCTAACMFRFSLLAAILAKQAGGRQAGHGHAGTATRARRPLRHPLVQRQAAAFSAARPCKGGDLTPCVRHPAAGWRLACPAAPADAPVLPACSTDAASKRCPRTAVCALWLWAAAPAAASCLAAESEACRLFAVKNTLTLALPACATARKPACLSGQARCLSPVPTRSLGAWPCPRHQPTAPSGWLRLSADRACPPAPLRPPLGVASFARLHCACLRGSASAGICAHKPGLAPLPRSLPQAVPGPSVRTTCKQPATLKFGASH